MIGLVEILIPDLVDSRRTRSLASAGPPVGDDQVALVEGEVWMMSSVPRKCLRDSSAVVEALAEVVAVSVVSLTMSLLLLHKKDTH